MKNHMILKNKAKEKINYIERLKEEAENDVDELLDHLLDDEDKISKLWTDLKYEKHDALNNIVVLESKLKKLEILSTRIDKIKNPILL